MSKQANLILSVIILIIMTVIFTLMSAWTPLWLDDNMFISIYREMNGGSDAFSWQALIDSWLNNRLYDNARMSNFCSPLSTVIEPWCSIFPVLAGLSCTAMAVLVAVLGGVRRNSATALALVWIAIVALLPWRNSLFVRDYVLNYPFSAVIAFVFACAMCAGHGERVKHPLWFCGTLLCATLLGAWHEGFAIPIGAGMGVWALTRRMRMPWQWWVCLVVLGVSTLLIFYCPGMLGRMEDQVGKPNISELYKNLFDASVPLVTMVALALGLCLKKYRARTAGLFRAPVTIVVVTALVVSFVMSISVQHTPRMSFFPILCSIILWMRWLQKGIADLKAKTSAVIIATCTALCTAQGVVACTWQYRLKTEFDIVERMMIESPTGTAFYDVYKPADVPVWTLYFPSRTQWVEAWAFFTFDLARGCDPDLGSTRQHTVVPTALKHPKGYSVSADSTIFTDGHNLWSKNIRNIRTGNYGTIDVIFKDNSRRQGIATGIERFVSLDGDTLLYLMPYKTDASQITSVTIHQ